MSLLLVAALLTGPTAPTGPCADHDWNGGTRDMRRAIGCVWDRFDMSDRAKAVSVAECESGLNPNAGRRDGDGYGGLYQHAKVFWAGRFKRFITDHDLRSTWGLSPSIWNGRTQAIVTALMVRRSSWQPWSCA